MSRWSAPGVAATASAWLLLITAAPILWIPLAGALYVAGSLICHQVPERSFHMQGSQLPVCARCFGLYAGAALGSAAGAVAFGRRLIAGWRWSSTTHWIGTVVAAIPTLVTLTLEWGLGWQVSNGARATAAVPLGYAVAFVVVSALPTLHSNGVDQLEEYPQPPGSTAGRDNGAAGSDLGRTHH